MSTIHHQEPIVTIAVSTYNRAEVLIRCIECLLQQDVAPEEYAILIIDNASTDDTQSIAKTLMSPQNNIRYCHEPKPGLSHARNRALNESVTPYVAFIDDDGFAPRHWLSCMIDVISTKKALLIGGPVRPYHDTTPPSWYPDDIEYSSKHIPHGWVNAPSIFGGNFVVHRTTALSYGGFNPELGMVHGKQKYHEETALAHIFLQHRHQIYFSHDMWIEHLVMANRYSYFFYGHNNFLKGSDALEMQNNQYSQEHHHLSNYLQQKLRYQLHNLFFIHTPTSNHGKTSATKQSMKLRAIAEQRNMANQMWSLGNTLAEIKKQLQQ